MNKHPVIIFSLITNPILLNPVLLSLRYSALACRWTNVLYLESNPSSVDLKIKFMTRNNSDAKRMVSLYEISQLQILKWLFNECIIYLLCNLTFKSQETLPFAVCHTPWLSTKALWNEVTLLRLDLEALIICSRVTFSKLISVLSLIYGWGMETGNGTRERNFELLVFSTSRHY